MCTILATPMWHCHTELTYFLMLLISMPPSKKEEKKRKKKKRVKQQTLPPWLNTDIKQAMLLRDKCRKQKKFVEYKQQRNRVNYLVREAKKKYFNDLAGNKADINNMCKTVSRNIFLLSKLSQIVSQNSKLAFFFAHIMSHMN